VVCLFCKKPFVTWVSLIRRGDGKYCGKGCYHKGRIGGTISEKHRQAIIKANTGKKLTDKTKNLLRKINLGNVPTNKGVKYGLEFRLKVSRGRLKGRIPTEPLRKSLRSIELMRRWRSEIFQRDNWTCQLCCQIGNQINADHYPKSFAQIINEFKIRTLEEAINCGDVWVLSCSLYLSVKLLLPHVGVFL